MKTKLIKLSEIVIDAETQQRERINDDVVSEYSESVKCGAKFPALTVFYDGAQYYLVDGFHRYHAFRLSEINDVQVDIHEGTKREARLFSVGVNGTHGLRLTNADKRKAVLVMLVDSEWTKWTNRDIAKQCNVSPGLVDKLRKEIEVPTVGSSDVKLLKNNESQKKLSTGNDEIEQEMTREEFELIELKESVAILYEENVRLKDAIAVNQLPDDIDIENATVIIDDLRKQVRNLEAELSSTRATRDRLMNTNAQLEKQCSFFQNKLKKAGIQ